MATPLITQVRDAFALIFAAQVAAGNLGEYVEFPPEEIDEETAVFPFLGYTIEVGLWQDKNRLELNQLIFHGELYHSNEAGRQELLAAGDLLEANLHKAIIADCKSGLLHSLTQKIVKRPQRNFPVSETIGMVVMEYELSMHHNYGDGFNNIKY